jgi:hypothetical protein
LYVSYKNDDATTYPQPSFSTTTITFYEEVLNFLTSPVPTFHDVASTGGETMRFHVTITPLFHLFLSRTSSRRWRSVYSRQLCAFIVVLFVVWRDDLLFYVCEIAIVSKPVWVVLTNVSASWWCPFYFRADDFCWSWVGFFISVSAIYPSLCVGGFVFAL